MRATSSDLSSKSLDHLVGAHQPIAPLFKADAVKLAVSASKDGKLRLVYAGWDDAKVVQPDEVLELRSGAQGVEARILPRRQGKR